MNWAALWTTLTSGIGSVKAWTAQMRAILWFLIVAAIAGGITIVLPRYDCKQLGFMAACESVERGYRP